MKLAARGRPASSMSVHRLDPDLFRIVVWMAALTPFTLATVLFAVPGAGPFVELIYPLNALAVGGLLYWRYPALYVSFAWWIWLLTPGVRRLVDYRQGWDPQSLVMLAPFLVTSLAFFTLLRHSPKLGIARFSPFLLVFLGLLYGYGVGIINLGMPAATFDLLNWLAPVLFAFYLAIHWRSYPLIKRSVWRTFVWGVLLLGLYGVLQYVAPPPWDQYWMLSAPIDSIGLPEPFGVRVFSTLNSPGPLALFMMAGVLLLISGRGTGRWPVSVVGYTGLLLSLVRSAWGGWMLGVLFVAAKQGRLRLRLVIGLALLTVVAVPLSTTGPLAETVAPRLQTLTDLGEDTSLNQRAKFYSEFASRAFFTPLGEGLGSTGLATKLEGAGGDLGDLGNFDSGIMNIPFVLGWPGGLLYAGGIAWLISRSLRGTTARTDSFAAASQGILLAVLVQLVFDDFLVGVTGMVFWTFLGLSLAAHFHRVYADAEPPLPRAATSRQVAGQRTSGEPGASTSAGSEDGAVRKGPKVLFLDHTGVLGGAELCLLEIARRYPNACKVLLFSEGAFQRSLQKAGVEVEALDGSSAVLDVRREGGMLRDLRALPGVTGLVRRVARVARNYDVLYANSQKALVAGALAGKLAGKPVIWHLHDVLGPEHFSRMHRTLVVNLANRLVSRVLANSEASARAFVKSGGRASKVRVVYNGIDPTPFESVGQADIEELKEEIGVGDAPVIGAFSRLAPWKGQRVLLDAMVHLPGVHLLLVGDALFGEEVYARGLRERAEVLGVSDRVHFLGFREDVPRLMRFSDVVVHASTEPEPFGRMIVEGMLARRPVVATRAGGTVEIIEDGVNGLLVAPKDARAFVRALTGLFEDEPKRRELAKKGYQMALERFSVETMMEGVSRQVSEVSPGYPLKGRAGS